jgi:hypothetical protein
MTVTRGRQVTVFGGGYQSTTAKRERFANPVPRHVAGTEPENNGSTGPSISARL